MSFGSPSLEPKAPARRHWRITLRATSAALDTWWPWFQKCCVSGVYCTTALLANTNNLPSARNKRDAQSVFHMNWKAFEGNRRPYSLRIPHR